MGSEQIQYINPNHWYSGIYQIISPDGRRYYGSTVNFKNRWNTHFLALKRNVHSNPYLQNLYNKHPAVWVCEAIEYVIPDKESLRLAEQHYLDQYYGTNACINNNPVARRPPIKTGYKQSKETIAKRALSFAKRNTPSAQKGVPKSPEHRIKVTLGRLSKGVIKNANINLMLLRKILLDPKTPPNIVEAGQVYLKQITKTSDNSINKVFG